MNDVFQRRVDAWLAEDVDAYLACWHDDMVLTLAWAAPVSFDVHALAVDGSCVLADWTIRACRREDDVVVEWRGLSICELRDAKIAWWREHHLAPPLPVH